MDMKLKCIKSIRYLTEGKYYRLVPSTSRDDGHWVYKDDLNQGGWYQKEIFESIEDNRNDKIDEIDYKLISYFISSAGISEQNETIINELIKNNEIKLSDCYFQRDNTLLSYYVFDVATFMLETTNQRYIKEHAFHLELGTMLGLNQAERESSISQCKAFIMQYTPSIELLTTSSESKMVYSNLSKRYLKILGRNKDKFLEEVSEESIFFNPHHFCLFQSRINRE
jgi:hypothetical protein